MTHPIVMEEWVDNASCPACGRRQGCLVNHKAVLEKEEPTLELTTVSSAHKALRKLAKDDFDVMITDYKMPDMNGLELLEHLNINSGQRVNI